MTTRKRDKSLGTGVYFATDSYVGMMRRIVIFIVDLAVLLGVFLLFAWVSISTTGGFSGTCVLIYTAVGWAYMTILKTSRIRTLGYWLMGVRIVNLQGERPSLLRMTVRLMLWVFGPFNLLFDLLWTGIDEDRQTLRDRFASTCLVKRHADPIGTAEIHIVYYNAFGFALMYPRVMRPKDSDLQPATHSPEATEH